MMKIIDDILDSPVDYFIDYQSVKDLVIEQMELYRSGWISVDDHIPGYKGDKGIVVMIKLRPKNPGESPRMHGDIFTGVFYAGKFHQGFRKGFIMDVIEWMHIPNY